MATALGVCPEPVYPRRAEETRPSLGAEAGVASGRERGCGRHRRGCGALGLRDSRPNFSVVYMRKNGAFPPDLCLSCSFNTSFQWPVASLSLMFSGTGSWTVSAGSQSHCLTPWPDPARSHKLYLTNHAIKGTRYAVNILKVTKVEQTKTICHRTWLWDAGQALQTSCVSFCECQP